MIAQLSGTNKLQSRNVSEGTATGHWDRGDWGHQGVQKFWAAPAVDRTTPRARTKTPTKAALKSYDGILGQLTTVRHTPA